jgi:hypothetical protein
LTQSWFDDAGAVLVMIVINGNAVF